MLLNFSVTNYRSFKERADFSMFPAKPNAKYAKENICLNEIKASDGKELSLLPAAAIYGANASGKTNFIKALYTMVNIIVSGKLEKHAVSLKQINPFLLNEEKTREPTEFSITIIDNDGIIYEYGFSATKDRIHEEYLYAFPHGRRSLYYKRKLENEKYEYEYGSKLKGRKSAWEEFTNPENLLLSTVSNAKKKNEQLAPVYDWFINNLRIIGHGGFPDIITAEYCLKSDENKNEILDFLTEADMCIDDVKPEHQEVSQEMLEFIKQVNKDVTVDEESVESFKISTVRISEEGNPVDFDLDLDESKGTFKMFALSYPILSALKNGHVLFVDELDNSLHHLLVRHVISLFNDKEINKNNAQLIFSSHNTNHFNDNTLRWDQIWLCNKGSKGASEIYSLAEYNLRNGIKNLQARYLSGRYDAIPNIES